MYNLLVIDDEVANAESLHRILSRGGLGYSVEAYTQPREALDRLRRGGVDLVLTDLRMDGMSGLELMETGKLLDPSIEFVLITAYGTVDIAVEAMKKGASDFITKPLQRAAVLKTVEQALKRRQLVVENETLRARL